MPSTQGSAETADATHTTLSKAGMPQQTAPPAELSVGMIVQHRNKSNEAWLTGYVTSVEPLRMTVGVGAGPAARGFSSAEVRLLPAERVAQLQAELAAVLPPPPTSELSVGMIVERREVGKAWQKGYVTSVQPLKVTYNLDDGPAAAGYKFQEVRLVQPPATAATRATRGGNAQAPAPTPPPTYQQARAPVEETNDTRQELDTEMSEPAEEGEPPLAVTFAAWLAAMSKPQVDSFAERLGLDEDTVLDVAEDEDDPKAFLTGHILRKLELLATEKFAALKKSARDDYNLSAEQIKQAHSGSDDKKAAVLQLIFVTIATEVGRPLLASGPLGAPLALPVSGEPEPELAESHGKQILPALAAEHDFHLVFSNKTAWDALCLEVRSELLVDGARVWQQKTNIPKDSENWFSEWYPSAVRARKIVCFISADYLKSPYCMKEWRVAESKNKLLVVACEPLSQIAAVDPSAYPHASNALAYLDGGGQVIFNGRDDVVAEIRKFM